MTDKKAIEGEVIQATRKRKYEPWMCEKIIEVAEQGGHVPAMLKAIGVRSKDTFYRWLSEYPEFKEAYETSKIASQAFYEEILLAGALGKIKGYNFNSIAMVMNNKFNDEYQRSATGSNTQVSIGSINNLESLSNDELMKRIDKSLKKMNIEVKDDSGTDS